MRRRLARGARTAARWLKDSADYSYGMGSLLASLRRREQSCVVERWPGGVDLDAATRVAIFSHFDRRGNIAAYVEFYLRALHASGYAVLLVSNAPRLDRAAVERVAPICAAILRRDNVGRDFGGFKDGLQAIPRREKLDSLVLANDSVYGPFHDLGGVIGRMDLTQADVWGITDSWERCFHLQSFFLLFGRAALTSEAFQRFWRGVRYVQAKQWIIVHYEIGLTRALIAGGLRCRALFPYRTAVRALRLRAQNRRRTDPQSRAERRFFRGISEHLDSGTPLNPTHFLWEVLIAWMGCPFLKRELLRDNPARIPGVQRWEQAVQSVSEYDTDLIVRDLEVSLRRRTV
jgi:Rhamnan synthesis protein F